MAVKSARSPRVRLLIFSAGPRIVRPSGVCWNAVACKWSKTTSSGTPSTLEIKYNSFRIKVYKKLGDCNQPHVGKAHVNRVKDTKDDNESMIVMPALTKPACALHKKPQIG